MRHEYSKTISFNCVAETSQIINLYNQLIKVQFYNFLVYFVSRKLFSFINRLFLTISYAYVAKTSHSNPEQFYKLYYLLHIMYNL